jgi:hypothetical protein
MGLAFMEEDQQEDVLVELEQEFSYIFEAIPTRCSSITEQDQQHVKLCGERTVQ